MPQLLCHYEGVNIMDPQGSSRFIEKMHFSRLQRQILFSGRMILDLVFTFSTCQVLSPKLILLGHVSEKSSHTYKQEIGRYM